MMLVRRWNSTGARIYNGVQCPIQYLQGIVQKAVSAHSGVSTNVHVERANVKVSGDSDFQTNVVLKLAKSMKAKPLELGKSVLAEIPKFDDERAVEKVEISGPGFLQFTLSDTWLGQAAFQMAQSGTQMTNPTDDSPRVLIDFGSPNMGKELHVGHLRSSVIGDTLARLHEFIGHDVKRISHVGDMGAAISTLLAQMLDTNVSSEANITPDELSKLYEQGKSRLDNQDFVAVVQDIVRRLQSPEERNDKMQIKVTELWQMACSASRMGFDTIWGNLGVEIEERGESSYRDEIDDTIQEIKAHGLTKVSNGALCIFIDGEGQAPLLVQKQSGGYLYATTDLAALRYRLYRCPRQGRGNRWNQSGYDRILYVTDSSQSHHFRQLFKVADRMGWVEETMATLEHISFGLVLGDDGRKLSSRKGGAISLRSLLNEAVEEVSKRNQVVTDNQLLGYGAIRYFELSHQRERDYQFSYAKALNTKGNTSIYLLYANARLESILKKFNTKEPTLHTWQRILDEIDCASTMTDTWHPAERGLVLLLSQFRHTIDHCVRSSSPHFMCDYLFRVATAFHAFYESCPVMQQGETSRHRLVVCAMTKKILNTGLGLLNIPVVNRI